jgi:hypothetical protein
MTTKKAKAKADRCGMVTGTCPSRTADLSARRTIEPFAAAEMTDFMAMQENINRVLA